MTNAKKMNGTRLYILGLTLVLMGMVGCAHTIKQTKSFSDIGIKYSEAMSELLDVTTEAVIDRSSEDLLYLQKLTSYDDKKIEKEKLKQFIEDQDDSTLDLIKTLGRFRVYVRMLNNYFVNLLALADADSSELASNVVTDLSDSINKANESIRISEKIVISESQKKTLSGLGGIIFKGYLSMKLQEALKRDAPIIGEQLILHEELLKKLTSILEARYGDRYVLERKRKVLNPYINKEIKEIEEWKESRKKLLKSYFYDQSVERAKSMAQKMRHVWKDLIAGNTNSDEIRALFGEINELISFLEQLE